jgi:hypothetical protein
MVVRDVRSYFTKNTLIENLDHEYIRISWILFKWTWSVKVDNMSEYDMDYLNSGKSLIPDF